MTHVVYVVLSMIHVNVGSSLSSIASPVIGHTTIVDHEIVPDMTNIHPVNDPISNHVTMIPVSHQIPVYVCEMLVISESMSCIVAISPASNAPLNCMLTSYVLVVACIFAHVIVFHDISIAAQTIFFTKKTADIRSAEKNIPNTFLF